jgi:hypothetical protein
MTWGLVLQRGLPLPLQLGVHHVDHPVGELASDVVRRPSPRVDVLAVRRRLRLGPLRPLGRHALQASRLSGQPSYLPGRSTLPGKASPMGSRAVSGAPLRTAASSPGRRSIKGKLEARRSRAGSTGRSITGSRLTGSPSSTTTRTWGPSSIVSCGRQWTAGYKTSTSSAPSRSFLKQVSTKFRRDSLSLDEAPSRKTCTMRTGPK